MTDIDYAGPLIRLDEAVREIYPNTSIGNWTQAFKYALKAQEELTRFMQMCVQHRGVNAKTR